MLVVIRGAGDIASGIALRLYRAGIRLVLTDLPNPTAVRRTVCFSEAIRLGEVQVEDVAGRLAHNSQEALELTKQGIVPVLADPEGACIAALKPDAVVDAILAKKNLGTHMDMAPRSSPWGRALRREWTATRGGDHAGPHLGPGALYRLSHPQHRCAGEHRRLHRGARAPRSASGVFKPCLEIGAMVKAGDVAALVGNTPIRCTIDGCLRGLLQDGIEVFKGMKCGDIDPRCKPDHCLCASDKALAVGGGVLEALLHLTHALEG